MSRRSQQRQKTERTLVGQGTYGCVYRPAIPCVAGRSTVGKVSKILDHASAMEELAAYDNLQLEWEDPDETFTVKKPESCRLPVKYTALLEQSCRVKMAEPMNLIYTDGGQSFSAYAKSESDVENILGPLLGVFQIVNMLNSDNKYHMDIKPANIVIDAEQPERLARLIDFGLAINNKPPNLLRYSVPYMYWPPETVALDPRGDINAHIKAYTANMKRYSIDRLMHRWGINMDELLQAVAVKLGTHPPKYREIVKKADLWGLAITILQSLDGKEGDLTASAHENLTRIIRAMLDPDISKRPDASRAEELYIDFIQKTF